MNYEEIVLFMSQLGFSENETKLYLKLLELGPSSIAEINKITRIPRTTITENLSKLCEKRLVSKTFLASGKKFAAEEPKRLQALLNEKRIEASNNLTILETLEGRVPNLLNWLDNLIPVSKNPSDLKIRYYEGKESVGRLYDQILTSKEIRTYYNEDELSKHFPENYRKFKTALWSGTTEVWDILYRDTKRENSLFYEEGVCIPGYHEKLFPTHVKFKSMDYLIHDGCISIVEAKEAPTAILIKNNLLYENAKVMFNLLWDLLP